MIKTEFIDLYEELSILNEETKKFTDSQFPTDLTKQKVYMLNDNYWLYASPNDSTINSVVQNYLLDTSNTKYMLDTFVKPFEELKDTKFCNTNNPGFDGDKVFFLPKGIKLQFVKDIMVGNECYHMFSTGKIVFIFPTGSKFDNYLQ